MKEKLAFVAKYIVGIGLLTWLFIRFDAVKIFTVMTGFSWPVLALLMVLVLANLGLQFLRWRFLVVSHSTDFQAADLLPAFLAGFAFRMMLPGGYAEVGKILLMPGRKKGKLVAFGVEKYFETYIKLMLVLVALPLVFTEYRLYLWGLAGIGFVGYFFLPRLLRSKYISKLHEKKVEYHLLFFKTLLFTLVIFSLLMAQYALLLKASGFLALDNTVIAVVLIWGGGLIPISVSGLGVRENLAVYFLGQYGIPPETAVAVAFLIFFLNGLLPAAAGAVFIIRKRSDIHSAGKDIRQTTRNLYKQYRDGRKQKKAEVKKAQRDRADL